MALAVPIYIYRLMRPRAEEKKEKRNLKKKKYRQTVATTRTTGLPHRRGFIYIIVIYYTYYTKLCSPRASA